MAMTKAEKAAMEALQMERDMYRAMYISEPVEPDIEPDGDYRNGMFDTGWLPRLSTNMWVAGGADRAATTKVGHRIGDNAWDAKCTSWAQVPRSLYSSKSKALRASRRWLSMDCAKRLALLDREIEAAEREEASGR